MAEETYIELTKRCTPVTKNEIAHLSWRNSVLAVRKSKRLHFLEYAYNLECLDRNLDFAESALVSPTTSPATEVCKANFLKSEMRNADFTDMLLDSAFWPHNQALTQEMTSITMCKWSPQDFLKSNSVLAVLNNIGGVEFFIKDRIVWKSILNLSPYITKLLEHNKKPGYFEELKESVYILETSAICWAPELNSDDSCCFVTAQKNGILLFWQLFSSMNEPQLIAYVTTNMEDMSLIRWIPKSEDSFFIVGTNLSGQISAFDLKLDPDGIKLLKTCPLWPHKDRMTAVALKYLKMNDKIIFITSKHRHLLVQAIDNDGNILSQYLNNINDHRISDIVYSCDGIYVTAVNVAIYKVNVTLSDANLKVDLIPLVIKEPYPLYELYSLRFSPNNVMCALAMVERKVQARKEALKLEIIFIGKEMKPECMLDTLLSNPTKKLTHYWDCVELLRFQITKLKWMPKLDYNELYASGARDIYKLKIYLILLTYISGLRKVLRLVDITLPETSTDVVREKILYLHANQLLDSLCTKCQNEGQLSDLDMESLYGTKKYLEYYSKKYKTEIQLDQNVLNALENSCEYVCQCCDEQIEGFTCKSGHLNMFCMATFTPITSDDYLTCQCCNATSRADLEIENPICVFCDLYLVKPD
ncbi:hypothetical protein SFRURICE_017376 [Spodoptera frugiperda]|uniref:SFRICE_005590 n=1 Tax=Spodoptera frugiperda TaxID=7108 RepID=A0A2H1V0F4_SPOFR|nr:hypothetical protein SFRURICE_017376 [Spodoptera frugiperda]